MGGTAIGHLAPDGRWIDGEALTAVDADGAPLPRIPPASKGRSPWSRPLRWTGGWSTASASPMPSRRLRGRWMPSWPPRWSRVRSSASRSAGAEEWPAIRVAGLGLRGGLEGGGMRVLSWNILHGGGGRREAIRAAIAAIDPDLVTLQEVRRSEGRDPLLEGPAGPGADPASPVDLIKARLSWPGPDRPVRGAAGPAAGLAGGAEPADR